MDPITGALVSAGVQAASGLLGKLFGRNDEKKAQKAADRANENSFAMWQRQQEYMTGPGLMATVRGAEAAGINPLSLIRSGSGNQVTQLPSMAMASVPASGNIFGDALVTGVNQYMASYQSPHEKEMADLEKSIAYKRLDIMGQSYERIASGQSGPMWRGSGVTQGTTFNSGYDGRALDKVFGEVTVTNPWSNGWLVDPNQADAAAFTDRFGEGSEIGEVALMLKQAAVDLKYNLRQQRLQMGVERVAAQKRGSGSYDVFRLPGLSVSTGHKSSESWWPSVQWAN